MPDGLNQILSNGLRVLPSFSEARLFLNDAGLDASLIRLLEDEDKFSSEHLLSLTNKQLSDTDLEKQLRLFLKKRWALIHRTNGSIIAFLTLPSINFVYDWPRPWSKRMSRLLRYYAQR